MDIGEGAIHSLLGLKSPWSRKPPWAEAQKGEGVTSRRLSYARSHCSHRKESRRSLVLLSASIEKKPGKGEAAKGRSKKVSNAHSRRKSPNRDKVEKMLGETEISRRPRY